MALASTHRWQRCWTHAPLWLALWAAGGRQVAGQSHQATLGRVTSEVVDEAGKPIAGARAQVTAIDAAEALYGHHTLDVLARAPLHGVESDAGGHFTFTLTSAHRRLGTGHEPAMTLVIEADGYQAWHEPLPFGLTGFHGTRAVLHRLVDADLYEITVEDPPAGALLWLRRIDCDLASSEGRVLPVPPGGVVAMHAPLLPTPCVFDDWRQTRGLGHDVQLWTPGRSSAPLRLDPRTRKLRIEATDTATRALRVRTDAAPAVGVRGLYVCPDGERRWLPSPDDCVREDHCLRLLAVAAEGSSCAVPDTGSFAAVDLTRIRNGVAKVTVGIAGETAAPKRLSAWSVPLENWPRIARARFLPQGAKALPVDGNTLEVSLSVLQQEALLVVATDCSPWVLPPLSGAEVPERIELRPASLGEAVVLAVDDAANPMPGADVRIPLSALATSPRTALILTTDGLGAGALPPLPLGRVQVLCVDDHGYGLSQLAVVEHPSRHVLREALDLPHLHDQRTLVDRLQPGKVIALEGRTLRANVRAPFAAVTIESATNAPELRTRKGFADAFGRVHVGYVGDAATISCRGVLSELPAHAALAANVLELNVPAQRLVGVDLPTGARVTRVHFWLTEGGMRHENLALAADRLVLGWRQDCRRCDVMLTEGPPATILPHDLEADAAAWSVVNRQAVVRTVPLHVFCGGQPVTDFEVRPVLPHSSLLIYDQHDGSPLRDGVWSARDRAAHELIVFHREFLPSAPISVPASEGGRDKAIIVELVRGTMVRFRIPRRATPPAGHDVHITIHDGGKPQYQVTLRSPGPVGGDGAANGHTEFLLPFALPPEHYAAELQSGREHRRVTFIVDGSGEVIVK